MNASGIINSKNADMVINHFILSNDSRVTPSKYPITVPSQFPHRPDRLEIAIIIE